MIENADRQLYMVASSKRDGGIAQNTSNPTLDRAPETPGFESGTAFWQPSDAGAGTGTVEKTVAGKNVFYNPQVNPDAWRSGEYVGNNAGSSSTGSNMATSNQFTPTTYQSNATGASNTGTTNPAYTNPTAVTQNNQTFGQEGSKQFMIEPFMQPFDYNQQEQRQADLVSGFQGALSSQETMPQMRQRLEGRYFIPELRETFQRGREGLADVVSELRALPENIRDTSRESTMTEAQRQNLISAKSQPLREVAARLGENMNMVGQMLTENERNLSTDMQMEIAQQKKELMPWEWKYNFRTVMDAREFSGWTFSNQTELNRLMANQQAGLTWTNAEAQRAHDLSIQENAYKNQLDLLEKQYDYGAQYWG